MASLSSKVGNNWNNVVKRATGPGPEKTGWAAV